MSLGKHDRCTNHNSHVKDILARNKGFAVSMRVSDNADEKTCWGV